MKSVNPYHQDGDVTIYHGDCREILPALETVESILTDPPYGTGYYATDTDVFSPDLAKQIFAHGWTMAIFGWPEHLVALCVSTELVPSEWVTWWPTNGACRGFSPTGLWRESEHIAIFGEGKHWSRLRRARSDDVVKRRFGKYKTGRSSRNADTQVRLGDVWTDAAPNLGFHAKKRLHPNEKPTTVMHRLIEALTDSGDTILDPFMGSGTTLRAAKDLGRKAIGIEIEEKYCEIAAKRMEQATLGLDL